MSRRVFRLLLVGIVLTLIGVVGMGVRATLQPGASLLPFAPFYASGLVALVVALFWWLAEMGRGPDRPSTDDHSSSTTPDQ